MCKNNNIMGIIIHSITYFVYKVKANFLYTNYSNVVLYVIITYLCISLIVWEYFDLERTSIINI